VDPRQVSVQEAFDRHAYTYDERFSDPFLGESIRSEVWQIADGVLTPSSRILDLGSGTGEDAIHFARQGMHVTAIDISSGMIRRLMTKAAETGISSKIDPVLMHMDQYLPQAAEFDAIISNFGALNCVPDLTWLQELARRGLKPGSRLILTTMGRFYPLETAVFLLKGQFARAFRRSHTVCEVSVEGVPVRVHYHSLRAIRRMLGPRFNLEQIRGLRAFLPVPGWEHLGRTAMFRRLGPIDRIWCRWRFTAPWADHFLTVWRYQP
jgi:ubiquinone/menaquinone biosynthesis C-methylase UbiE